MLQSSGLPIWMGLRDCTTITSIHEQKCLHGRHLRTRRLLNFSAVHGQRAIFRSQADIQWPWSQLWTWKQFCNLRTQLQPISSGSVTSTVCQGTWEEFGPSVNQVIGTQTSSPSSVWDVILSEMSEFYFSALILGRWEESLFSLV